MLPFVCSCWTALHRLDKEIPRFLRLWEIFRSAEKGIFPFGKALGPAQFFQRHPLEFCPELLFHHGVEFPQRSVLGSGGDQPFRIFHTGEDVPQRDVFRAAGKGKSPCRAAGDLDEAGLPQHSAKVEDIPGRDTQLNCQPGGGYGFFCPCHAAKQPDSIISGLMDQHGCPSSPRTASASESSPR